MAGAATFLDVVTILSGVLMLCVAFIILYNKLPEIAEEWRILMGRETVAVSAERRRREVIAKAMHDIEACKDDDANSNPRRRHQSTVTPTKAAMLMTIRQVPTVESPESQDSSIELALHDVHDEDEEEEDAMYNDDYVAKFMKHRKMVRASSSPHHNNRNNQKCESVADSCSVYLEGSVQSTTSTMEPMSYADAGMISPCSKADKLMAAFNAADQHRDDNDDDIEDDDDDLDALSTCMSYSLDTIENKESFSSYARPTNYSHIGSRIDDDTTTGTYQTNPFSFLSKNNITFATNVSEDPIHKVDSNLNDSYEESIVTAPPQPSKTTHTTPIQEEEEQEEETTPPPVLALGSQSEASKRSMVSETSKRSRGSEASKYSRASEKSHYSRASEISKYSMPASVVSKRSDNTLSRHSALSANSKSSTIASTNTISPSQIIGRRLGLGVTSSLSHEKHSSSRLVLASAHSAGQRSQRSADSSNVASRDSFSPLARRNVTFSSTLLDESSSDDAEYSRNNYGSSNLKERDIVERKQSVDSSRDLDADRRKPKITIITNKSLLSLEDEDSEETPSIEKGITPYTVSTTGLWSPSASMSPQTSEDDLDHHDVSFSTFADSLPSDEAADDHRRREAVSPLQDVHVCRSASCTACRYRAQNTPTFLSTSKASTGEHYTLERKLPARWWDSQLASYGQLKQYVSKILLSTSTEVPETASCVLNRSVEDHPFDEK